VALDGREENLVIGKEDKPVIEPAMARGRMRHPGIVAALVVGVSAVFGIGLLAAAALWLCWPPRMSPDIVGGTRLVYEFTADSGPRGVEKTEPPLDTTPPMDSLIRALKRRLNPRGFNETVITPYSESQVEILVPQTEDREVERIKRLITTAGMLEFRIVANRRDHADVIAAAVHMAQDTDAQRAPVVRNDDGQAIGRWARVGRERGHGSSPPPFKIDICGFTLRDADSGDLIEIPSEVTRGGSYLPRRRLAEYAATAGIQDVDVLMAVNDGYDVRGSDLGSVSRGVDEVLQPCINFTLVGDGIQRFANLTGEFAPEGPFRRYLGIVLDNQLLSAPTIQSRIVGRGRITGQFTNTEVELLVSILRAGSLPAVAAEEPIIEELVSGSPTALRTLTVTFAVGLFVLLVVAIALFVRYGLLGFAASLAALVQLLLAAAVLVVIAAPISASVTAILLTMSLVALAVDAVACSFERGGRMRSVCWFIPAIFFGSLFLLSLVFAMSVTFAGRSLALALLCSVLAALVVQTLLWVPVGLAALFVGRRN
jgi:SecD/SecF fusion protein